MPFSSTTLPPVILAQFPATSLSLLILLFFALLLSPCSFATSIAKSGDSTLECRFRVQRSGLPSEAVVGRMASGGRCEKGVVLGSLEVLARALLEGVRWCACAAAAWVVGGVARGKGGGRKGLVPVAGAGVSGLEAPAMVSAASGNDSVVGTGWSKVGVSVILRCSLAGVGSLI